VKSLEVELFAKNGCAWEKVHPVEVEEVVVDEVTLVVFVKAVLDDVVDEEDDDDEELLVVVCTEVVEDCVPL